jgi:solute carrier family 24 (sodium/potassium/calcium exchanger), member 6
MAVLSVVFSPGHYDNGSLSSSSSLSRTVTSASMQYRWLEENTEVGDDANSNSNGNLSENGAVSQTDYSSYSCHYIFDKTPNAGDDRCQFAHTCNQGSGIWAPFVFCSGKFSANFLTALLSPLILLWMVLLFRMLGSTAEDYFSPALEMFSVKLGLPPRFAGVSLLALGNGAADVSATISAITNDPENGYKLSLGALTGAAMVIGSVVSALVVLVAGGVPCRGALVRDVTALLIAILVVWNRLGSGKVGPESVTLFLSLYVVFVVLVLVADVYHRAVVVPRRLVEAQNSERLRQQTHQERLRYLDQTGDLNNSSTALSGGGGGGSGGVGGVDGVSAPHPHPRSRALDSVLTALSNYDNYDDPMTAQENGWGIESDDLQEQERPVMLHGSRGILHGGEHIHVSHVHHHASTPGGSSGLIRDMDYSILEDATDLTCVAPGSLGKASMNWIDAFQGGKDDIWQHANEVWDDIMYDGDINMVTKFLLLCELPFTVLRKLTVPIPCEGYYVRGVVALSLAVSPVWFAYYLWEGHDVNVLNSAGWVFYLSFWLATIVGAVLLLRFAPGGEGDLILAISTPIALYGFAMGATWIDTLADSLVSLLDFVGIVLRIPGPIVGLTILAWGNSMGDLSANITMARKGLANMAVRFLCLLLL